MLFLFIAGITTTSNYKGFSIIKEGANKEIILRLLEPTEGRSSSYRAVGKVEWQLSDGIWIPINEKVMLYFSVTDTSAAQLKYGSILAAKATFASIPGALNPYQFDYREFLARKQIYRTAFVPSDNWILTGIKGNPLLSFAFSLREKLLNLYCRVGIEGENLAVLSALTMGYKSLLDEETKRVFSTSGAMHILAVSGLHVGILFATISAFLFFLGRIRRGRFIKAAILIGFLWFFAIFTGLSPSVIRAALMFSLVIIGTAYTRKTNIYNTLSASAFIILSVNPILITEVGFLLSYFAVLSIVFFYPHIYGLIYVKSRWLDKVWVLVAVSVSAQIGTFAIGMFYFHQFPNYFIFTNLYAIPLAFFVLYLSIALIVFSPIPIMAMGIGWLLDKTLLLLNVLIRFTDSLPYSTTTGVSISSTQMIMIFSAIILFAVFLEGRKYSVLLGSMACLFVFFIENAYISLQLDRQHEMVIFNVRQRSVIGFTHGRNFTLAVNQSAENPWESYAYNIDGYINRKRLLTDKNILLLDSQEVNSIQIKGLITERNSFGTWFNYLGYTIFVPQGDELSDMVAQTPLDIDILILGSKSNVGLDKLFKLLNPTLVIVDSSVPRWKLDDMKTILSQQGVLYHIVERQGAYVLKGSG
jgi:competence protein ComEC